MNATSMSHFLARENLKKRPFHELERHSADENVVVSNEIRSISKKTVGLSAYTLFLQSQATMQISCVTK